MYDSEIGEGNGCEGYYSRNGGCVYDGLLGKESSARKIDAIWYSPCCGEIKVIEFWYVM